MPLKRPTPLSDDLLAPKPSIGATNNGQPLPVKNTFIDVPSGLTPSNMKTAVQRSHLMTAPADLSQPPGLMNRAMASASALTSIPPTPGTAIPPTPGTSRVIAHTPMATPSPTSAPFMVHSGGTVSTGFAAALRMAAAPQQPATFAQATPAPFAGFVNGYGGTMVGTSAATASSTATFLANTPGLSYSSTAPPITSAAAPPMATAPLQPTQTRMYSTPGTMPLSYTSSAGQPVLGAGPSVMYGASAGLPYTMQKAPETLHEGDDEEDDDSDDDVPMNMRNPADAPKPPEGAQHPSMGSEAHALGSCKRCCFFPRGRCMNGYNCEFCHYEHEKRKRKNKKKKKKDNSMLAMSAYPTMQMAPEYPRQYIMEAGPPQPYPGLAYPDQRPPMQYSLPPQQVGAAPPTYATAAPPVTYTQPAPSYSAPAPGTSLLRTAAPQAAPLQMQQPPVVNTVPLTAQISAQYSQPPPPPMQYTQQPAAALQPAPVTYQAPVNPPNLQQLFDRAPPPPMQSPKALAPAGGMFYHGAGQAYGVPQPVGMPAGMPSSMPPPPMSSPKLPMELRQSLLQAAS
eukprot:TRINITY_DN13562_c0_g1_i1.p1 TRINITY_DN13562_c0_g1~~TRINITY_DN13562_c0_g1_i1.p1  ORF type:complete len:567 (+),score=123.02 TRINITY_DN13562_c0_g1_i1:120-1820(+)